MGNEFTDFEDNAPTLTLEPVLDEPKAEAMVQPEPRRKWQIFPMQLLKMFVHRIWVR